MFFLLAELVFTVSSLVVVKIGNDRKNRYHPQGGTVRIAFGGKSPVQQDSFGGIKDVVRALRPASTPGVTVKQFPLKPVKKDTSFPF